MNQLPPIVIEVKALKNQLGGRLIHDGLSFEQYAGEIIAIIGASGCGKTTLLRTLLMLQEPVGGEVSILGKNFDDLDHYDQVNLRRRWGMMFQSSALFSSLSILENVMFPLDQLSHLSTNTKVDIAYLKLRMCGLSESVAEQYPSDLSGGMKKRAALARAIALDPELLFLDEPSAGLDPESAAALDQHLIHLRDSMGLTQLMVTHDLDTLWTVPDRVMFLGEGRVLALAPMSELVKEPHPVIQAYFSNTRSTRFFEGG